MLALARLSACFLQSRRATGRPRAQDVPRTPMEACRLQHSQRCTARRGVDSLRHRVPTLQSAPASRRQGDAVHLQKADARQALQRCRVKPLECALPQRREDRLEARGRCTARRTRETIIQGRGRCPPSASAPQEAVIQKIARCLLQRGMFRTRGTTSRDRLRAACVCTLHNEDDFEHGLRFARRGNP